MTHVVIVILLRGRIFTILYTDILSHTNFADETALEFFLIENNYINKQIRKQQRIIHLMKYIFVNDDKKSAIILTDKMINRSFQEDKKKCNLRAATI